MSLRVYVSGASADLDELEALVARIRAAIPGVEVLDRWMLEVRAVRARGLTDADLLPSEARLACESDITDVSTCHAFVFVVPKNASIGAWVELGYAMARRTSIFVLGDIGRSIFLSSTRVFQVMGVEQLLTLLPTPHVAQPRLS